MKKDITILAIESSCDETACAIVTNGRHVHSDVVYSQIDIHKLYGGVVPEIASRNHILAIDRVVEQALSQADMTLCDIDAIAVTYGAGLVGALFVGVSYAKGLSQASGIPLIAVNHIEGHICANYITHKQLEPPFMCLLTSGGSTSIVNVLDYNSYDVLASTVDDAVGEAFDKVARVLHLPYPGGVHVDRLAQQGQANIPFHSVVVSNGNFSYSGLKTAVINYMHNCSQKGIEVLPQNLCASFNKVAIDGLIDRLVQLCHKTGSNKVAIAGGVSANSYLRNKVSELSSSGLEIYLPQLSLCGDNASMIASRAYYQYIDGDFATLDITACPTLKLRGNRPQ